MSLNTLVRSARGASVALPDDFTPNRPSGLTTIQDTAFTETLTIPDTPPGGVYTAGTNLSGVQWARNVASASHPYTVQAAVGFNPYGPNALISGFAEGSYGNDGGPTTLSAGVGLGLKRLYCSMLIRFEAPAADYSFHTNGEKWWYPFTELPGGGGVTPAGMINIHHSGATAGHLAALKEPGLPFTALKDDANQDITISEGVNILAEFYATMNTPGNADGVLQVSLDGVLMHSSNDNKYYDGLAQQTFSANRYDCTRGGGTSIYPVPTGGMRRVLMRILTAGSTEF